MDTGLFGPQSMLWQVQREGVLFLGSGRALCLQVAHPLVSAGVEQHSSYREDPWGRLLRTIEITNAIVFGERAAASAASRDLLRRHAAVKGETSQGQRYRALDPALMLWVHATLVESSLSLFERYVRPLSERERERYYDDVIVLGEAFGVKRAHQPATIAEFKHYYREALGALEPTETFQHVWRQLERPPAPRLPLPLANQLWPLLRPGLAPLGKALRLEAAAAMPPELRLAAGISYGPREQTARRVLRAAIKGTRPLTPRPVRHAPLELYPRVLRLAERFA